MTTLITLETLLKKSVANERAIQKNKKSQKALAKAKRKLKTALTSKTVEGIRIAIGMAQVALDKAQFLSSTLNVKSAKGGKR
jgi:hypothetical protein